MMKSKFLVAAMSLCATFAGVASANAQLTNSYVPGETFFTAGSSAQWNTFAVAGSYTIASYPLCGTNHWTYKSGSITSSSAITLNDPRSSSITPEPANVWIAWSNNFAAGTSNSSDPGIICIYASVDSIVGVRAYEAHATLNINTSLAGKAGTNQIALLGTTDTTLPAAVLNWINANVVINSANTDIRPEDAKFATMRALTSVGQQVNGRAVTGQGYGPGPIGTAIKSSQSFTIANPVDFAIDSGDTDPVNSANPVRGFVDYSIGAAPVLVIANVTQTGSGHLGYSTTNAGTGITTNYYTNINRFILARALQGTITHVRDLGYDATYNASSTTFNNYTLAGETDNPLTVVLREPLSGTYNTMEFSIPMAREIDGDAYQPGTVAGQEANVVPSNTTCTTTTPSSTQTTAAPCTGSAGYVSGNPLYVVSSNGSIRERAVGTGEVVTTVNNTADAIGYAFWGFSTFKGKTNIKYLTVDGVDPLFGTTAGTTNPNGTGVLPTCTGSGTSTVCAGVPFTNIVNGTYPIWSKYRMISDPSVSSNIASAVVYYAQLASNPSTGVIQDFVPAPYLQVFHSHYAQVVRDSGVAYTGNNGIKYQIPETGGDMGGAVLTIQSELDYINDTGNQQINEVQ